MNLELLVKDVEHLKKYEWKYKKWLSSPALIDKSGGSAV